MKILGTGLNGLVGSRIVELLSSRHQFENVSRTSGVDITDYDSVLKTIQESDAPLILHVAAKADVDGCEKDKAVDTDFKNGKVSEHEIRQQQTAWAVNVIGTKNVAEACSFTKKKLIYVSTDTVFDGELKEREYTEEDTPNPLNWYGMTKFEGEKAIQKANPPAWLIVRLAYPYRADFPKIDFVRAIKNRLVQGQPIKGITDHSFCPTFIDDFAHALDSLIQFNEKGIFHAVGGAAVTPFDAAQTIADVFQLDKTLISPTTRAEYFKDKAPRPFRLALKNDKINGLGVYMKTLQEGLEEIKKQGKG